MRPAGFILALTVSGVLGAPGNAQTTGSTSGLQRGSVISPILVIDSDRMFFESAFGLRVVADYEAQAAALAADFRQIEADLEAEEKDLTEKRAAMPPEDFRELADVFDAKVQETRSAQAAKGRALNEQLDRERLVFEAAAAPVLERLMRNADAAVILERRSVFANDSAIEITDSAIALLDETLGSGSQ